ISPAMTAKIFCSVAFIERPPDLFCAADICGWRTRPHPPLSSLQRKVSAETGDAASRPRLILPATRSDVQVCHVQRVFLDELAPWLDFVAHQPREKRVGVHAFGHLH